MDHCAEVELVPPHPASDPILKYWQRQRDLARTPLYTQPLAVGAYQLQWGGFRVHRSTSDPQLASAVAREEVPNRPATENGNSGNSIDNGEAVEHIDDSNRALIERYPGLYRSLQGSMASGAEDNPFGEVLERSPGLVKWRVESFVPVEQTPNGQFHSGDAYILLHTTADRPGAPLHQDIHFWIGKEASQDEMGAAAILASQLDSLLGGALTIHRHVQGQESEEFLQMFAGSGGVRCLKGGIASGFKQASDDKGAPVLFSVSGSRAIRVTEMEPSAGSLNSSSCFVLGMQGQLIQWNGKDAKPKARICALDLALQQRDDVHGGGVEITTINEGDVTSEGAKTFFEALGCSSPQSLTIAAAPAVSLAAQSPAVLYKMEGELPSPFFKEASQEPLSAASLEAGQALVLDTGAAIYVWLGSGVAAAVRQESLDLGAKFAASHGDKQGTIQVVKSGLEPPIFKQYFPDWARVMCPSVPSATSSSSLASGLQHQDLEELISQQYGAEEPTVAAAPADQAVSEGRLTIWLVKNFEMVEWPQSCHGEFYSADSFVVLNTFESNGRARHVIYFWQGRDSDVHEKGAAAMLTTKIDQDLNGKAVQVRVVQNKEPKHFLQLFKGSMVVHIGDAPEGGAKTTPAAVALYHCKGEANSNARAVQVPSAAVSLNASDVYVLLDLKAKTVTSWRGAGATAAAAKCGETLAARLLSCMGGSFTRASVEQGKEPVAFWEALGGKDNVQVVGQDEGTQPRWV